MTNRRAAEVIDRVERIDTALHFRAILFAAIVGPDRVSALKPSGAHLKEAVERVGGDLGRCLMVGDSLPDLLTARANGVPCVLTSFGYTETPARELGADAVIDRFGELPKVIERLLA